MTYCSLIDKPTHPPKVKHKFYIIKTFFKFFSKFYTPIVYVDRLTTPTQDPQYNLRGWDIPPLTRTSDVKTKLKVLVPYCFGP